MEEKQASPPASGISPTYFGIALLITVLSFAAGMAVGFFVRPIVLGDKVEVVEVLITATPAAKSIAKADSPTATPLSNSGDADNAAGTPAAENADSQSEEKADSANSGQPDIMDIILDDVRHFQGEADAPITIIEFSDFK